MQRKVVYIHIGATSALLGGLALLFKYGDRSPDRSLFHTVHLTALSVVAAALYYAVFELLRQPADVVPRATRFVHISAPSLLFKSEAIVHPDDVVKYISSRECQISYNPLQMALLWNTLATREVNQLQQALENRHHLPPDTAWVNYVRSHDDIGWTFSDEDALKLGIHGFQHRQFLNRFYVNRFEGSFARGVPFQDNPATGDCRICGTCASLGAAVASGTGA